MYQEQVLDSQFVDTGVKKHILSIGFLRFFLK